MVYIQWTRRRLSVTYVKTTTDKFFDFDMIVSQQHRDSPSLLKGATSPAIEEGASHPNAHQGETEGVCGR